MEKITKQQLAAAAALARGVTVREAAAAAKASERTVYNWKKQADFSALVSQLTAAHTDACADHEDLGALALDTVRTLALSAESEHVKLKAALALQEKWVAPERATLRELPEIDWRQIDPDSVTTEEIERRLVALRRIELMED